MVVEPTSQNLLGMNAAPHLRRPHKSQPTNLYSRHVGCSVWPQLPSDNNVVSPVNPLTGSRYFRARGLINHEGYIEAGYLHVSVRPSY